MTTNNAGDGEQGTNKGGDSSVTDTTKTSTNQTTTIDFAKLGDEDFQKVFDDPRIFKHPRFKNLGDRAKKADELEKAQVDAEQKRLAEQGKWQELAEAKQAEAEKAKTELAQTKIDQKIIMEAQKHGVVDLDAVTKLIDRTNIKFSSDGGTIDGVESAIKSLLETKTYLKGSNNTTIGTGSNPSNASTTGKRFTLSQIQNAEFYRANEKDILQSAKLGLITNDLKK